MVKSLKNHISENSFYNLQSEKDEFLDNEKAIIQGFIFGFIGMISMMNVSKPASVQKIKTYFKQDQQLRVASISDSNNDSSLIIKIMVDKGFFKTPATANQITKFLVIMKQGGIDNVDESIVRGWVEAVKPEKLLLLKPAVRKRLKAFTDGGSLLILSAELKDQALRNAGSMKETEFFKTMKVVKYDMKKVAAAKAAEAGAAASAAAMTAVAPDPDPVIATPDPVDSPADPVADAPTPATPSPATKKPSASKRNKFDLNDVLFDIKTNPSMKIDDYWKISGVNRLELLTYFNYVSVGDPKPAEWDAVLAYLKLHNLAQPQLLAFIFKAGFSERSAQFLSWGVWDLVTVSTVSDKILQIIKDVVFEIVWEGLNTCQTLEQASAYRKSFGSFLKSLILTAQITPDRYRNPVAAFYFYLIDKSVPDVQSYMLMKRSISKTTGDVFVYDPSTEMRRNIYPILMDYYGIRPVSAAEGLVKKLQTFGFEWDDITSDEVDLLAAEIEGAKDTSPAMYEKWGHRVLEMWGYAGKTTDKKWLALGDKLAEGLSIENIMAKMLEQNDDLQLEMLPDEAAKIILLRIKDYFKKGDGPWLKWRAKNDFIDTFGALSSIMRLLKNIHDHSGVVGIDTPEMQNLIAEKYALEITIRSQLENQYWAFPADRAVPNDKNSLAALAVGKMQDAIDTALLQNKSGVAGPISKYAAMTPENQKTIREMIPNVEKLFFLRSVMDKELLDTIPVKDMIEKYGFIRGVKSLNTSLTATPWDDSEYMEKMLADPAAQEKLNGMFDPDNKTVRWTQEARSEVLIASLKADSVSDADFTKWATVEMDRTFTNSTNKRIKSYYITQICNTLSPTGEDLTQKEKVVIEKAFLAVDENLGKNSKDYKEFMTVAQSKFMAYVSSDRKSATALYASASLGMRRRLAAAYMAQQDFAATVDQAIAAPNALIKPYGTLSKKRLAEMLEYNNVVSEETKISTKHIESFDSMDKFIEDNADKAPIQDLQITQNEVSKSELDKFSAMMHRTKRSGKHGSAGLKFLRSFNVAIPLQVALHAEWLESHEGEQRISPMFHGAGSIAATMILRYGFKVLTRGDGSVVGRMLGDGIYGATNIDKSAQYVGDKGFGRGNEKGYLFEMDAALGTENKDYRVMGLGNDNIRSPEWAVYTPNAQFLIVKAYEVQRIQSYEIKLLLRNNPKEVVENTESLQRFKSYLKENIMEESENFTTFTFINGLIPMSAEPNDIVELEDFKSPDPSRITMEPSQYGPTIVVSKTENNNDYLFKSPTDLIENHPQLFDQYVRFFQKVYV